MKKILTSLLLLTFFDAVAANNPISIPQHPNTPTQPQPSTVPQHKDYNEHCSKWWSWTKPICIRFHQIWTEGKNEFYLSGYAWHNRFTYEKHKIRSYNEAAWGGGVGKGFYDEKGNWHGLTAIAFLDSHKHVEPLIGYTYLKIAHLKPNLSLGAGYSVVVTQRSDIFNGIPFPGALPWISLTYRKATLLATYIPGAAGAGNVLYIVGKFSFDLF